MNNEYKKKKMTLLGIITYPNHTEQTLIQEEEKNLENLKRIMYKQKIRLPSLRNYDWRQKLKKINKLLTHITTKNIELNKTNLFRSEISLWKNANINSKIGWEIWLEMQIRSKNDKTKEKHWNVGTKKKKQQKKKW